MLNTVRSEWIKLSSLKSLWITTALTLIVSIGMAWLMAKSGADSLEINLESDPDMAVANAVSLEPTSILAGLGGLAVMIILVQSVLSVTSEYNSQTSKITLLGTPQRFRVPLAKVLVYGVYASVLVAVTALVCLLIGQWLVGKVDIPPEFAEALAPSQNVGLIFRTVITMFFMVVMAIGVGYLLRSTALSITVLLLWSLVVETLIGSLPKIGDYLPRFMPFQNYNAYYMQQDLMDAPWGANGSGVYFALFAVVIFLLGTVMLKSRDA